MKGQSFKGCGSEAESDKKGESGQGSIGGDLLKGGWGGIGFAISVIYESFFHRVIDSGNFGRMCSV